MNCRLISRHSSSVCARRQYGEMDALFESTPRRRGDVAAVIEPRQPRHERTRRTGRLGTTRCSPHRRARPRCSEAGVGSDAIPSSLDDELHAVANRAMGSNTEARRACFVAMSLVMAEDRSDLPRISLHGLRHTHATLALQANAGPRLCPSVSGTRLEVHAHVLPGMQERISRAMSPPWWIAPVRRELDAEQFANVLQATKNAENPLLGKGFSFVAGVGFEPTTFGL